MKVRSWKDIVLQLLLGGLMIAYGARRMAVRDSDGGIYILMAIIMWIHMVLNAISGEEQEEDMLYAYAKR